MTLAENALLSGAGFGRRPPWVGKRREDFAEDLIRWLMAVRDNDPGRKRITALIEAIAKLRRERDDRQEPDLLLGILDQLAWYARHKFNAIVSVRTLEFLPRCGRR